LLFEVFSQRYERGSTVVTSNLPFDEWTSVFGSERLTGALLDTATATKALSPVPGVTSSCSAVNHLLKSVVREIRTLRSVWQLQVNTVHLYAGIARRLHDRYHERLSE